MSTNLSNRMLNDGLLNRGKRPEGRFLSLCLSAILSLALHGPAGAGEEPTSAPQASPASPAAKPSTKPANKKVATGPGTPTRSTKRAAKAAAGQTPPTPTEPLPIETAPPAPATTKTAQPTKAKTAAKTAPAAAKGVLLAQNTPPAPKDPALEPAPEKDAEKGAEKGAAKKNGKAEKTEKGAKAAAPAAPAPGSTTGTQPRPTPTPAGPAPRPPGAQPAGAQPAGAQPAGQAPANQPGAAAGGAAAAGREDTTPAIILPEPGQERRKVLISEGKIPLLQFLKFLADYTGLPLLHDSTDQNIATKEIHIVSDIQADEEVAKALLEVNRFRVFREVLPSGKEIIKVESMQPQAAIQEDEKEKRIVDNRPGASAEEDITVLKNKIAADEFATMVFELKHTAPRDASEALNSLVGTGVRAAAPGAAGARGTKSFSMVEIKNTMMLVITAKFGLLNYIKRLLELIDVPLQEPDRIIHIIDIQEADAEELRSTIEEFLQGQGGGRGGRSGIGSRSRLRTPSGTPVATPTPGGVPGTTAGGTQQEYRTNLIPDYRTNKIIVETYSEQDLQDILMLVNELDVPYDMRRLRTHIYYVRYLKATEVANDLQALLSGGVGGGLTGLRRGAGGATGATRARGTTARRTTAGRLGTTPTQPGVAGTPGAGGSQNAPIPSLIVPHEPTNSLLIQAEPEEFDEILNVLSKIDTKRRQVFLEAALVQVQAQSSLNYTIELLAGNPDDEATRALFASSFNLTGIDFENFSRVVPDLTNPASVPAGGLAAIMHRGKLPAIVSFFKQNQDSQILATPFVLADDNKENSIEVLETRYVVNTATVNTSTTSSQQGEPAGITLGLTPTISGSEKAVYLELDLTVSDFNDSAAAVSSATPTLPPKNENHMTSAVTIPDGKVFVVGGLTRQGKSKTVRKVPLLGDLPLIGKLFRSESTASSQNNLYIFLQAHILTDEEFLDGLDLTRQGEKKLEAFDPSIRPAQFQAPAVQKPPAVSDDGSDRYFDTKSRPATTRRRAPRPRSSGTTFSTREPAAATGQDVGGGTEASPRPRVPSRSPAPEAPAKQPPAELPSAETSTAEQPTQTRAAPAPAETHGWLLPPPKDDGGTGSGQE